VARLRDRDVRALLAFLRDVHGCLDPDDFARRTLRSLLRLVPADRCSYNEVGRRGTARTFVAPDGLTPSGALWEALTRFGAQNPVIDYYRRTGDARVATYSDFATRSQFHRTALYNEYYRHVGVEHQIVAPLALAPSSPTREIGFALSRGRPDFSARDRLVLELLQPHLIQAHANAQAVARLRDHLAWAGRMEEVRGQGAIRLAADATIAFASPGSRRLLERYFGPRRRGDQLPEDLARWVRAQDEALDASAGVPSPRRPLGVVRDGACLWVRIVADDTQRTLLLEERAGRLDPAALAPLGLTARESEVLAWVAEGKSNEQIAAILGARPATVAKHLERVYRKLGVESRTAAAVHALSVAGLR